MAALAHKSVAFKGWLLAVAVGLTGAGLTAAAFADHDGTQPSTTGGPPAAPPAIVFSDELAPQPGTGGADSGGRASAAYKTVRRSPNLIPGLPGGQPADGADAHAEAGDLSRTPTSAGTPAPGPRGRYQTLLKQVEVPNDRQSYGDFYDYGYWAGTSYAGHADLPAGYWVYVAPTWHIYQTAADPPPTPGVAAVAVLDKPAPHWGTEQALGKPDTAGAGDIPTAWASATQDGQREWLELTYDAADVEAVGVMVFETYNPGAVDGVVATVGNEQVEVWAGRDPTDVGKPSGVSVIGFKTPVKTARVRINLDSQRVAGWNEIDAVGLIGKDGTVRWATAATASSTYGTTALPAPDVTTLDRLLVK